MTMLMLQRFTVFYLEHEATNLGQFVSASDSSRSSTCTHCCGSGAFHLTWLSKRHVSVFLAEWTPEKELPNSEIFYPVSSSEPSAALFFFFSLFFSFLDRLLLKFWITPPFPFSWSFSCVLFFSEGLEDLEGGYFKHERTTVAVSGFGISHRQCWFHLRTVLISLQHETCFSVVCGPVQLHQQRPLIYIHFTLLFHKKKRNSCTS